MKCLTTPMLVALFALSSTLVSAQAQEWPVKPVRIVFPFSSGGGGDLKTRLVAAHVGQRLGQNFVVENLAGAGGIIGTAAVARAAPDGYTLLGGGIGSLVIAPLFTSAPYDPIKSFTHIALFGGFPALLMVNLEVEAKTLKDFIALTKARPNGFGYGSPGIGTHNHLIGELFRLKSGANIFHIPYKGGSEMMRDLMGNFVQAGFIGLGGARPVVSSGKVRALAISSARRIPALPDIPTFAEAGYGDFIADSWFGLSGPAGLPTSIVNRLNTEVRAALALPDVRKEMEKAGAESNKLDSDGFTAFIRSEVARWTPVVQAVKVQPAQ